MSAWGHDRRGPSGLEYALFVGMVVMVLASLVVGMQRPTSSLFGNVNTLLANG